MNLLPDMIIIDFCEWLQHTIKLEHQDLDFLDLMINEQCAEDLTEYASLFLRQYEPSIKSMLHQFIESEYFENSLDKCDKILKEQYHYESWLDYRFIHYVFLKDVLIKAFVNFIKQHMAT